MNVALSRLVSSYVLILCVLISYAVIVYAVIVYGVISRVVSPCAVSSTWRSCTADHHGRDKTLTGADTNPQQA
ncbi:hypothetical protein SPAR_14748 [Streptomyces sparsogenes DSM 40356]|uniref:Uncharacterized protein n=1 Tax=Streptomyces sparsogenes DSM 40356 TaxID=1331668 RepID=A0A1R1SK94_9ACTN|nr:hypothetical protein SPAR_14748 [Streptomyces sparsogenes DSM 40356]